MTEEAGVVTGELELETRIEGASLTAKVRYLGAEEWYEVYGSPLEVEDSAENHSTLHGTMLERLTQPGPVVDGNEEATSLADVS